MNHDESTRFDRLRAWADASAPVTQLEPEMRALADDFRTVHALTGLDACGEARSKLTFGVLAAQLPRSQRVPRAAAAAVLLAAIAGAIAWRVRHTPSSEPLALQCIPVAALAGVTPPPCADDDALPARFADFDPRGEDGRVQWLTSDADARLLARASRRPLLVFGTLPGCPLCAALDKLVFADAGVVETAERFVPLRIDLASLPKARAMELVEQGYPFLEVWNAEGSATAPLVRAPHAARFVASLFDALAVVRARDDAPSWEVVRARAQRLTDARRAESELELAAAEREYRALAASRVEGDEFAQRARSGLARIERDAVVRFEAARARTAVDDARAEIEQALAAHRGTSYELDFAALLVRLEQDGRFPEVVRAADAPR
ncbi:MAG: thioredoxin family protein [Planctomycetota bacterium]